MNRRIYLQIQIIVLIILLANEFASMCEDAQMTNWFWRHARSLRLSSFKLVMKMNEKKKLKHKKRFQPRRIAQ